MKQRSLLSLHLVEALYCSFLFFGLLGANVQEVHVGNLVRYVSRVVERNIVILGAMNAGTIAYVVKNSHPAINAGMLLRADAVPHVV